jgi:hypothetical protein
VHVRMVAVRSANRPGPSRDRRVVPAAYSAAPITRVDRRGEP